MHRLTFTVVTFLLVVLCIFGAITAAVRKYIPAGEPNELAHSAQPYLASGGFQPVRWRELTPQAFADARRLKRPILLVVGSTASANCRWFDQRVFTDRRVATILNSSYVSVRIDVMENPAMAAPFRPLKSVTEPPLDLPGCWVLTSTGELEVTISTQDSPSPTAFAVALTDARDSVRALPPERAVAGAAHLTDLVAISGARPRLPNFSREWIELTTAPTSDGEIAGRRYLWPAALDALIETGRLGAARTLAREVTLSPQFDWVDGGFYHMARTTPVERVEFDKWAVENAEMMVALQRLNVIDAQRMLGDAAERTQRFILERLASFDLVSAAQIGDECRDGTSARASVRRNPMRFWVDPETRELERRLNLGWNRGPQRLPYVSPSSDYPAFRDRILAELETRRATLPSNPPTSNHRLAWVTASVVARLIEYGRLNEQAKYGPDVYRLAANLDAFIEDQSVTSRSDTSDLENTTLHAYVAMTDALEQGFLATGDDRSATTGVNLLMRATREFDTGTPGVFSTVRAGASVVPRSTVPELVDFGRTSASARMIRQLTDYGRLFADRADGSDLARLARQSALALGEVVPESIRTAGYFAAALYALDDRYVVTVGPHAVAMATRVARLRPTRLAFPAAGAVRRDVQKLKPGAYVSTNGVLRGPMTPEEAAVHIPLELHATTGP